LLLVSCSLDLPGWSAGTQTNTLDHTSGSTSTVHPAADFALNQNSRALTRGCFDSKVVKIRVIPTGVIEHQTEITHVRALTGVGVGRGCSAPEV